MEEFIHVTVEPFGPATDFLGTEPIEFGLAPPATLRLLVELLTAKYPRLATGWTSLRFAINGEYADLDSPLSDRDEVAIIPPVAGGNEDRVRLTHQPIDLQGVAGRAADPSCGAMAIFQGVVRADGPQDNPVVALEYSAFASMAVTQMQRLRTEAIERFGVRDVAIVHRIGRLGVGEVSVVIGVSAPHRTTAFDACRWVIDTLKRDVPIWKKEIRSKGESAWVDPAE